MKIKHIILAFCLATSSTVYAGLDEAFAAYEKQEYKKAYLEFLPLAKAGDSEAQRLLSQMYMIGEYVPENNALSIEWLKKSALQGNAYAQSDLGIIYSRGSVGVTINGQESVKWFTLAANQGDWNALNQIGELYIEGDIVEQNFDEAFKWRLKFVEAHPKSSVAAFELARMYAMGLGVSPNKEKAIDWYQRSIAFNTEDVLDIPELELGYLYYFGSLDASNPQAHEPQVDKAIQLWRESALKNNLMAQYTLANFYEAQTDFANSFTFYKMVAANAPIEETYQLGLDNIDAVNMMSTAQLKLARMYELGQGVTRNIPQAIFWYKKAALHDEHKKNAKLALKRLSKSS